MPIVTAYATAVPSNPGGWANPTNATGADDGAVATVSPARNVKAYIDLQLDPTVLGAIPADAVLVGDVNRSVWWGSSSGSQVSGYRQWIIDGTPIGTEETVTLTTGVTEEAAVASLTIEQLRSGNVVLRLAAVRTGTQARTFSLDAVRITFEYRLALAPVASFTANRTTVYTGQTVQFTDTSQNSPTGWSWNFDGGASASTSQNPLVTFNTPGVYNVTLTATNVDGQDTTAPTAITVLAREAEVWNGSAWVGGESWNGAAWVRPEVWDGTQWVPMRAP